MLKNDKEEIQTKFETDFEKESLQPMKKEKTDEPVVSSKID
jgi:hypothetical protein